MKPVKFYLAVAVLAAGTPALAGEITGSGRDTPVRSFVASSICSFSGLNDDDELTSDMVQNWGMLVRAFGKQNPYPSPGIACRGG